MSTSPFTTKATDDALITELVDNFEAYMTPEGKVRSADLPEGIKYSRAWLILRFAWSVKNQPNAFVTAMPKAQVAKLEKKFSGEDANWKARHVFGPAVVALHDEGNSWGEIMVLMAKNNPDCYGEGQCRKAFEAAQGDRKSVGLRTGKGGRYVADRGDLYTEHRQAEGAEIPIDLKASTVAVEQLINAEAHEVA